MEDVIAFGAGGVGQGKVFYLRALVGEVAEVDGSAVGAAYVEVYYFVCFFYAAGGVDVVQCEAVRAFFVSLFGEIGFFAYAGVPSF